MSTLDNSSAEQLWYTWSDVGLSTIHAGFRIRAASPGLSEIYSERVKSMDRYMRYVLPPGTDRFAITPDMAPVCLAFIRTDWNDEYILVHKNYLGEDGVGRLGNFFVHVVALGDISQYFSTADAILLWDSEIWKTSDKDQDRRSNRLDPMPLEKLRQSQIDSFQLDFAQACKYLPFIIEAYLTRKDRYPLYMAAPAHQVGMMAYLIAALVDCLPHRLVAGLTFSTYEPDVTKASAEIVGTCWIPTPGKEFEAAQVFSPQFYHEKLAVNCYTGDQSPLEEHPQITHKPLAADFAAYAAECLRTDDMDKLYDLLNDADESPILDVDMFLSLYNTTIVNAESTTEADIEKYLNDPYLCLGKLCNQGFRKSIVERAAANRQWSDNRLYPRLRELRNQAQREYNAAHSSGQRYNINDASGAIASKPVQIGSSSLQGSRQGSRNRANKPTKKNQATLAQALFFLAKRTISDIIEAMISVGAWRETVLGQSGADEIERQNKTEAVAALLIIMDSCLLPQNSLEVWKGLFDKIAEHPKGNAIAFLTTHWEIFLWLLKTWDHVFPVHPGYDEAISPLLIIPWNSLGEFLKLNLRQRHRQWNVIAVKRLIKDTSLTPQIAQELEQNSSKEINDLLAQLLQESDFTNATYFAIRLIEKGYPVKSQIVTHIESLLAQLILVPQLWADAKYLVVTLTLNGYVVGTESYLNLVETLLSYLLTDKQDNIQTVGVELFNILVEKGYPRKKNLVDLLRSNAASQVNLESILERVYRTPKELNAFFIHDGSNYLSTPDQAIAMVQTYKKLLQQLPQTQKLERLFVLLDTLRDGNMIIHLLDISQLEELERVRILTRYGKSYLKMFRQIPQLANKVVQWYIQLVNLGYSDRFNLLCALFTSTTDPRLLENLLLSAQLSLGESQEFFKQYGSSPPYFPFFYRSATIIDLFSKLAQKANMLAGSGHNELATEKMHLLLAWLQPSQSQPLLPYQTIEKLLQAAFLMPNEQIDFLEHYGEVYLSLYPQSLLFRQYVSIYANAFTADWPERTETKSFFTFLTRKYQRLDLDTSVQEHIRWWMIIDSYLTSPDARPEVLKDLSRALYYTLALPNNSTFTRRLATAFVSCVRTSDDLSHVISSMQQVPKLQVIQLLYIVAEQAAAQYRQRQDLRPLVPYLLFVLSNPQESFVQIKEGQKYFRCVFLDTLLHYMNVLDIHKWKELSTLLIQCGLSGEALEQWHDYLNWLQLLGKLQSGEGIENGVATPEAQPQPSPSVPANDSKPVSWFARFPFKFDSSGYRSAKKKLDDALRSRRVDRIAAAWSQYGAIISEHPDQITKDEVDQINDSHAFEQYYQAIVKNPNSPINYANKLVELHGAIQARALQLSSEQNKCVEQAQARIQAQPENRQPYQNPGRIPSGSLPRQNRSPSAGQTPQGPNPIEIKSRSDPRDIPGPQSQSGATRFDTDIQEENKKNRKRKRNK